ncbi:hypothetical protein [Proteiniphilum sp.]|uniref:hypothetical protein n=1 Tax=Proteiniphilum sp. TaxID=1926877 RepID=UPI00331EB78B
MSRTTAILLLPLMMIFAIQPVIALHYCAGELQSLNLFAQPGNTNTSPIYGTERGNNHSCCDAPKTDTAHHDYEWHAPGERCCDTQLLELTTDDYQNKVEQPELRLLPLSIEHQAGVMTQLYQLSDPFTNIQTLDPDFPPEGLFLKDVSLLTYICIYRI